MPGTHPIPTRARSHPPSIEKDPDAPFSPIEHVLRLEHNARQPIARLPVELLSSIFVLVAESTLLMSVADYRTSASNGVVRWAAILRVCHGWRQVALHSPKLWATFRPVHPEYVRLALERAGNMPLRVGFGTSTDEHYALKRFKKTEGTEKRAGPETLALGCYELLVPHFDKIEILQLSLTPWVYDLFAGDFESVTDSEDEDDDTDADEETVDDDEEEGDDDVEEGEVVEHEVNEPANNGGEVEGEAGHGGEEADEDEYEEPLDRHMAGFEIPVHALSLEELDLRVYIDTSDGLSCGLPLRDMDMPQLKTLSVAFGTWRFLKHVVRPTITHLRLEAFEEYEFAPLLEVLESLPCLRQLHLRELLMSAEPGSPDFFDASEPPLVRVVELPNLVDLDIFGGGQEATLCAWVLDHFALSASAKIVLESEDEVPCMDGAFVGERVRRRALAPMEATTVAGEDLLRTRSIFISYQDDDTRPFLVAGLWTTEKSLEILHLRDTVQDAKLKLGFLINDLEELVDSVIVQSDFSHVTTLSLVSGGSQYVSRLTRVWRRLFARMPHLRELALQGAAVNVFVRGGLDVAEIKRMAKNEDPPNPHSAPDWNELGPAEQAAALLEQMGLGGRGIYAALKVLRLRTVRFAACPDHACADDFIDLFQKATRRLEAREGLKLERLEIESPENFTAAHRDTLVEQHYVQAVEVIDWGKESWERCKDQSHWTLSEEDDSDAHDE